MKLFSNIYHSKRVLVTGHTGFKGSWLTLWLHQLGAEVTGIALPPEMQPNHWDILKLPTIDLRLDIRDISTLQKTIDEIKPEIVFHLAAQPLVRRSYLNPIETWAVNVMGTANVLEACRNQPSVRAIVAITTDKCYENQEWHWGYRENDRLGGHDPYSASKACAELLVSSYRHAFFHAESAPLLATARAGNVIGGGDWSKDRLIPDLVRALHTKDSLEIRSPYATRPWQHVLESLSGYLSLGQKLLEGNRQFSDAWNFGPEPESNRSVSEVLSKLEQQWEHLRWHVTQAQQPHEALLLHLDSSKAKKLLQWQPVWGIDTTLSKTADWYRAYLSNGKLMSHAQLYEYISDACIAKIHWAYS